MDFESYFARRWDAVERRLEELLPSESQRPEELHKAIRYAVLGGGKRFRPLLCIASCEAVGGNTALDAGCALEMVHCFSLIHDDLPSLDNDDLRRGKPSCHIAFGEALALLAGDALFALAFETLARMDLPLERNFESMKTLAVASGTQGMVGGQTVDIESENRFADDKLVSWIHSRKTGALIAASCRVGAIVAGGSAGEIMACENFGRDIGLAFQITDDLLNETGKTAVLGKRAGSDRERSKATFPSVLGIDKSKRLADNAKLRALLEVEQFGDRAEGLRLLAELACNRAS